MPDAKLSSPETKAFWSGQQLEITRQRVQTTLCGSENPSQSVQLHIVLRVKNPPHQKGEKKEKKKNPPHPVTLSSFLPSHFLILNSPSQAAPVQHTCSQCAFSQMALKMISNTMLWCSQPLFHGSIDTTPPSESEPGRASGKLHKRRVLEPVKLAMSTHLPLSKFQSFLSLFVYLIPHALSS